MEANEKKAWNRKYLDAPEKWLEPDQFLLRAYDEFLRDMKPGEALDLAGGAGRNAIWLAQKGWQVRLIDISDVGLGFAREKATKLGQHAGRVEIEIADLNTISDLGSECYNLIAVFFFLRRALFPALIRALKPGGFLIYKTYTLDRMKVPGGPGDPRYLLGPNELLKGFAALRILHYHETLEGKAAAELVAQRANHG
jgi:tellurite methyltransferase